MSLPGTVLGTTYIVDLSSVLTSAFRCDSVTDLVEAAPLWIVWSSSQRIAVCCLQLVQGGNLEVLELSSLGQDVPFGESLELWGLGASELSCSGQGLRPVLIACFLVEIR